MDKTRRCITCGAPLPPKNGKYCERHEQLLLNLLAYLRAGTSPQSQ